MKTRRSSSELSDADTNFTDSGSASCDLWPQQQKKTLLLWDYDDTLLCTSHLARLGVSVAVPEISEALRAELADFARVVEETLELAATLGRVVIVTNAEQGWVELTSSLFIPSVYGFITSNHIEIVSARSRFECDEIRSPVEWKRLAFDALIARNFSGDAAHVVSFGDSSHERDAALRLASEDGEVRVKSLKLIERPDLCALKKQHILIKNCLAQIIDHPASLDLCIQSQPERTEARKFPTSHHFN
jgi:hypothetical protein